MTIKTAAAADARVASEHVLYEIEMFCAIASYLESGAVDSAVRHLQHDGLVVRNAMVEAFQLHARQLIDFLTGTDSRDMSASDFTKTKWRRLNRTQRRRTDFDRFSQRVMHLSLRRAEFTTTQQRVASRRIRHQLGDDIRRRVVSKPVDNTARETPGALRARLTNVRLWTATIWPVIRCSY